MTKLNWEKATIKEEKKYNYIDIRKKRYTPTQKQLLFIRKNSNMKEDQISRLTKAEAFDIIGKIYRGRLLER